MCVRLERAENFERRNIHSDSKEHNKSDALRVAFLASSAPRISLLKRYRAKGETSINFLGRGASDIITSLTLL